MTNQTLTDWFPASVKPVRVGVYEVKGNVCDEDHPAYAHWDGEHWGDFIGIMHLADGQGFKYEAGSDACQNKIWRGLSKEPKF